MSTSLALTLVVVGLALTIMLHEAGHLLVAKACGMKVTQYFVGFGPRLWSVTRGDTEYGLRAIPAGGFVKIPGMSNLEEIDEPDEPRTYRQASFPRKLAVVSAGSAVHFLLAFTMLWAIFAFLGMPAQTLEAISVPVHTSVRIQDFSMPQGMADPARRAGLHKGDVIVSVAGHPITSATGLSRVVRPHPGVPLVVVVSRAGHEMRVEVTPADVKGHGLIGIVWSEGDVRTGPLGAVPDTVQWIGHYVAAAAGSIGGEFQDAWRALTNSSVSASSAVNANRPMSIVGAARVATAAAKAGLGDALLIFVMLNIFIGVFNLLPLPVLDGGYVAMAIYERIRSRKNQAPYHADYAKMLPVAYATVMLLVIVGGSLIYLDIVKPVPAPFR